MPDLEIMPASGALTCKIRDFVSAEAGPFEKFVIQPPAFQEEFLVFPEVGEAPGQRRPLLQYQAVAREMVRGEAEGTLQVPSPIVDGLAWQRVYHVEIQPSEAKRPGLGNDSGKHLQ